jgi:short-subunit dehydrogenase
MNKKANMKKVMIIGATSAIAMAVAKKFAEDGAALALVARDQEKLQILQNDLALQGAEKVVAETLNVLEFHRHAEVINKLVTALDGLDAVLIAHGVLPDQRRAEEDPAYAKETFEINATSAIHLLTLLAPHFRESKQGCIAVISSVAGDRGRGSNYVYGAAKAALTTFCDGLRQRLYPHGVRVLTIKPGFVDTPMTSHLNKNPLFATPERVANDIYRAMVTRKNGIIYTPWFWRWVMKIFRIIPEKIIAKFSV